MFSFRGAHRVQPAGKNSHRPQHHRGGEDQCNHADARRDRVVDRRDQVATHAQDDHGDRQGRRSRNGGSCPPARGWARCPQLPSPAQGAIPQIGHEPGPGRRISRCIRVLSATSPGAGVDAAPSARWSVAVVLVRAVVVGQSVGAARGYDAGSASNVALARAEQKWNGAVVPQSGGC